MTPPKKITLISLLIIFLSIPVALILTGQRQDISEQAAGSGEVDLRFDPSTGTKVPGETFTVTVKLHDIHDRNITTRGAQATIDIDSKLTIDQLSVKCEPPFDGLPVTKVEGQKITLLCANAIGANPITLNSTGVAFASFSLTARSDAAAGSAALTFTSTRVTEAGISGQAPDVSTSGQNANFTISSGGVASPTPGGVTSTPGGATSTPNPTIIQSPHLIPIGTRQEITINIGGAGTPVLTPLPTDFGPSPTPPEFNYIIDVGQKQEVTINIGQPGPATPTSILPTPTLVVPTINPNYPHIRFAVKLFGAERTPEIKVRLKVLDLVAQLTPTPVGLIPRDTCVDATESQHLFKDIRMVADSSGVYRPLPGGGFTGHHVGGVDQLTVATDGWIPLVGVTPGKIYAFSVKGPKHRNVRMVTNFALFAGIPSNQDFDWTANLLEPGDLPDPNISGRQDCVVNSVDISLIETRISATDQTNLDISDVNFDNVVNGHDVAQVVHTLSTKPDDDN